MMSLLKEFSNGGSVQNDLKTSDGSSAGSGDVSSKPVDVGFSLMRNAISGNDGVTGSDVNDYLERAHDINDEVDSVGFAIETDDGDIIKIYVNASQEVEFQAEMSKLLGLEGDSEEAINLLAQKYDIIDVVWPTDPNPELDDEEGDLSIDDDLSSFLEPDEAPQTPDENEEESDETKSSLMKSVVGDEETDTEEDVEDADAGVDASQDAATEEEPDDESTTVGDEENTEETPPADGAGVDDAGDEEADSEEEDEDSVELELDADGNAVPKKKKKKKKADDVEIKNDVEITADDAPKQESLLKSFSKPMLVELARDEITKHVNDQEAKGNSGKWYIQVIVSGNTAGRKEAPFKTDGKVLHFNDEAAAKTEAAKLDKKMNRAGATAHYKYTPRLVDSK